MKNKAYYTIGVILFSPILVIIVVNYVVKIKGDWLQFFGTYLGIIVSVGVSLYVTKKQGEIDNKNHAINLYIDNLMMFLECLQKLDGLKNRCKNFVKMMESNKVTSNTQSNELELLIKFMSDNEIKKTFSDLEKIVNKMPLSSRNELNHPLECLCFSVKTFGDEKKVEDNEGQYVAVSKKFEEDYEYLKKYTEQQLDLYYKID